jgi:hypothetical protein
MALASVISLDPGGTTGYAKGEIFNKPPMLIDYNEQRFDEAGLYAWLEEEVPDYLICESFAYRNRARAGLDLTPVKLIGIVTMYANLHRGCILYMQSPSQGKGHFSNDHLKSLGVYKKGLPHGRDAVRHLLHWYASGAGYQFNRTDEVPVKMK